MLNLFIGFSWAVMSPVLVLFGYLITQIGPRKMGTESKERVAVSDAYYGKGWKEKVKKMPDKQITAVYLQLKMQGKLK